MESLLNSHSSLTYIMIYLVTGGFFLYLHWINFLLFFFLRNFWLCLKVPGRKAMLQLHQL